MFSSPRNTTLHRTLPRDGDATCCRRLAIEQLEDRLVLATVIWDGDAGDFSWHTPQNWDGDQLPVAGDDVIINTATEFVRHSTGTTNINSLTTNQMFILTGGTLNIAATADFSAFVQQDGGDLTGSAIATFESTYHWLGGTQSGTGTTVFNSQVNVIASSGVSLLRTAEINGQFDWQQGDIAVDGNQIQIGDDGFLNIDTDDKMVTTTAFAEIINDGTILHTSLASDAFTEPDLGHVTNNASGLIRAEGRLSFVSLDSSGEIRIGHPSGQPFGAVTLLPDPTNPGSFPNPLRNLVGGSVTGNGTVDARLINEGLLSPGLSTGEFILTGGYIHEATATLLIEIGPPPSGSVLFQNDLLFATTNYDLRGGTVEFRLLSGFVPGVGEDFVFMSGERIDGDFAQFVGLNLAGGLMLDPFTRFMTQEYVVEVVGGGPVGPGEIRGTKFEDDDGDGLFDPGESGLSGWMITATGGGQVFTTTTDANGDYAFTGLDPGNYIVTEENRAGWVRTRPGSPSGQIAVNVTSGSVTNNVDFGNFELGEITGLKFSDDDGDGNFDAGEDLLAGITITLTEQGSGTVLSTVTDTNGRYRFQNLGPGTYLAEEQPPLGQVRSTANPPPIVLRSGQTISETEQPTLAFGNTTSAPQPQIDEFQTDGGEVTFSATQLLGNDQDPNDNLTLIEILPPVNGTLTDNFNGTFTYVAPPGFFGTETLTYVVEDSTGLQANGTIEIVVPTPNELPDDVAVLFDGEALGNGAQLAVNPGQDFTLTAGFDPATAGGPLTIRWVLTDPNGIQEVVEGPMLQFNAAELGTYAVMLTITDQFLNQVTVDVEVFATDQNVIDPLDGAAVLARLNELKDEAQALGLSLEASAVFINDGIVAFVIDVIVSDTVLLWTDPVDFVLTDPRSREIGFTAARGAINDIPNSYYSGNVDNELVLIPDAPSGEYVLELLRVDNGAWLAGLNFLSISNFITTELFIGHPITSSGPRPPQRTIEIIDFSNPSGPGGPSGPSGPGGPSGPSGPFSGAAPIGNPVVTNLQAQLLSATSGPFFTNPTFVQTLFANSSVATAGREFAAAGFSLSDTFLRESAGGNVDLLHLAGVWLTGRSASPLDQQVSVGRIVSESVLGPEAAGTLRQIFASDFAGSDQVFRYLWKNVARRTTGVPREALDFNETPLADIIGDAVLDVLIPNANQNDGEAEGDGEEPAAEQQPAQGAQTPDANQGAAIDRRRPAAKPDPVAPRLFPGEDASEQVFADADTIEFLLFGEQTAEQVFAESAAGR